MGVAGLRSSRPQSQRKTAFEGKKWSPFPPPRWETFTPPLTRLSAHHLDVPLCQRILLINPVQIMRDGVQMSVPEPCICLVDGDRGNNQLVQCGVELRSRR